MSQNTTSGCSPILAEPQQAPSCAWSLAAPRAAASRPFRASAMAIRRRIVSWCATTWAVSLETAPSGHQSQAILCPYRCRLFVSEGAKESDRNAEFKQHLQRWEAGQQRREKRTMHPQTEGRRGKKACALTASGSIINAMKGLVGGTAASSAERRKNWTTALIPRSSDRGTHLSDEERAQAAHAAWSGCRQGSPQCRERTSAQQDRNRFAWHP